MGKLSEHEAATAASFFYRSFCWSEMGPFQLSCTAVILPTKSVLRRVQPSSPIWRWHISVALIFPMQHFADIFFSGVQK